MHRRILLIICLMGIHASLHGADPDANVPLEWTVDSVRGGAEVERLPEGSLKIRGLLEPSRVLIAEWLAPKVPAPRYTIVGQTSYSGVVGDSYFEMLSRSPSGPEYFTRTKDSAGPLAKLNGQSVARRFELPFSSNPAEPPDRIQVWLVLAGEGEVIVGPLTVHPWKWSSESWLLAGGFSAVMGMIIGLLGGVFGLAAAIPETRRFAFVFGCVLVGLGVVAALAGVVLSLMNQSGGLWGPLVFGGALSIMMFGASLWLLKRAKTENTDTETSIR